MLPGSYGTPFRRIDGTTRFPQQAEQQQFMIMRSSKAAAMATTALLSRRVASFVPSSGALWKVGSYRPGTQSARYMSMAADNDKVGFIGEYS